jgi:regulatory protein
MRPRPPKSSKRPPEPDGRPPEERAFALALRALNRRERTVAQIRGWLDARGYEAEAIELAIARLTEAGALDDERFARAFAEDKRELAGWGEERIRSALEEGGVPRLAIEAALVSDSSELERARQQLATRGEALADDAARGRALAYLVRRGYASEVAYDAIRAAEKDAA